MNHLINIARQFVKKGKVIEVRELGDGNINQTFLVTVNSEINNFVLQQINTRVFTQPELVMDNILTITNHVDRKLANSSLYNKRRWQVPQVLFTTTNQSYYVDHDRNFWRAISYINNASSYNTVRDLQHAQELGYGLGLFHSLISDLDITQLADTLPGFHITPQYFKQYKVAINNNLKQTTEVKYCQHFIAERRGIIDVLERAKARGILKIRPIHGDPKINNIMIDRNSKAIALIDLDLAAAILQGYLTIARDFITREEINYIYDSIRLITFELGLRFFTDYLNNDIYFKVNYPEHNLNRALVQFKLVKSIEYQAETIKTLICNLSNTKHD